MAEKFHNKYRVPSARHPHWDYRWNAAYFITICTGNRAPFFGKILDGEMQLSNVGVIADILWNEIKNHAQNIELGEYVVMPNHIHGILILNNNAINNDNMGNVNDSESKCKSKCESESESDVQTLHATSLPKSFESSQSNKKMAEISPKSNSISTIIRSYKSAVTKHANRLKLEFAWQTRFHDHIIRDESSFQNISNYIMNNPKKWEEDTFHA